MTSLRQRVQADDLIAAFKTRSLTSPNRFFVLFANGAWDDFLPRYRNAAFAAFRDIDIETDWSSDDLKTTEYPAIAVIRNGIVLANKR